MGCGVFFFFFHLDRDFVYCNCNNATYMSFIMDVFL